jgi:hypothetical protein
MEIWRCKERELNKTTEAKFYNNEKNKNSNFGHH